MKASFIYPGIFGTRIYPKASEEVDMQSGNGDSVLINLERKIFAVADSPDWNPSASRQFLARFNRKAEDIFSVYSGMWNYDIENFKRILVECTNHLLRKIDFLSSTTFSCLIVIPCPEGLKGLIFHCGDSYVYKVNIGQKSISQISRTNMSFVGRSNQLSQVEFIEIDENDRFIICTDGMQALSRNHSHGNLELLLLDSFEQGDVDQIPDLLIDFYGKNIELYDDIATIVLNPHKLSCERYTLIYGGPSHISPVKPVA